MDECKISVQKNGMWNEQDRLMMAQLLVKAGYTVRIAKEKHDGAKTCTSFIGYRAE